MTTYQVLLVTLRRLCDQLESDAFAALFTTAATVEKYRSEGFYARKRGEIRENCPYEPPGTRKPDGTGRMVWVNPVPHQCWIDGWEAADREERLEEQ